MSEEREQQGTQGPPEPKGSDEQGPPRFPPIDERPPAWPPSGWQPPGQGPPEQQPPGYWPPGYGSPGYGPAGHEGYYPPPGYGYGEPGYPVGRRHWLHPLDVGRAFSTAWRLYRAYWRPLLGATFALMLPASAVLAFMQAYLVGPTLADWQQRYVGALAAGEPVGLEGFPIGPLLLSLGTSIAVSVVALLTTAAVISIIFAAYRGGTIGALDSLEHALDRLGSIVGVALLMTLGVLAVAFVGGLMTVLAVAVLGGVLDSPALATFGGLIGVVGTIAAVFFVGLRWYFATQIVMCEGLGAVAALRRSWHLVHGSTWRVLGYGLLVGLLTGLVSILIGIVIVAVTLPAMLSELGSDFGSSPLDPVVLSPNLTFITTFLPALAILPIVPYVTAVLTLLYFDLRWQRGETMADQPAPSDATAPVGG